MQYARRGPRGLRSLVLANSPPSIALWIAEANRERGLPPSEVRVTLSRHEAARHDGQ